MDNAKISSKQIKEIAFKAIAQNAYDRDIFDELNSAIDEYKVCDFYFFYAASALINMSKKQPSSKLHKETVRKLSLRGFPGAIYILWKDAKDKNSNYSYGLLKKSAKQNLFARKCENNIKQHRHNSLFTAIKNSSLKT